MRFNLQSAAKAAIKQAGGGAALGRALRITRQAIYQWDRIPPEHVLRVERITGITRHDLRPDLYGPAPTEPEAAQ